MKISILTSTFFQDIKGVGKATEDRIIYGGAERYLVELCHYLQELGHEVVVTQACKGKEVVFKQYQGIQFMCLPVQDNWDYHNATTLNINFHEMSLASDLRIYFASFLAYPLVKSPSIVINHGVFWDYAGGILSSYTEEQRKEFFRRQLFGMTQPDLCVAVDTNVRNTVASYGMGEERKIMYIPNFADTKEFYPRLTPRDWERPRILFPRRLVQLRGVNDFLLSASQLPDYDFYLCGQAFDETAGEQVNHYGRENIKVVMKPMERMSEIYREVDVAVIPTRASEGTSLSCLEAMASALPIITTPVGGLPNLVIDKFNGLVVDLNHDTLTESIKTLAESPELRKTYGLRNLELVHESFSLELWRERWGKALNKVIK
jgi:glycosyltransferase involved in cell wall biosynthesis